MSNPLKSAGLEAIALRRCRPEEVEAVLLLWREADATITLTDTVEDVCRAVADDGPACLLVAEAGGRIVGSVLGGFDGWRGNIYRLAVHPEYRRHGLARRLVAEVERHLVQKGARRVTALVEKDHAGAVAFWAAAGYELDTRIARFVHNL
jgi:ribosomal protein S18 acetylase RimI-like enzyme